MTVLSGAYYAARKAWQQRNCDGKDCYDEWGVLTRCQNPPGFTFTDVAMPPGISDDWPSDAEYVPHAIVVAHVWDASLDDPDS